jgi:hypothetical protein
MPLRTHALRDAAPCPDPAVAPAQAFPTPLAGSGRAAACARLASNPPECATRLLKRIGNGPRIGEQGNPAILRNGTCSGGCVVAQSKIVYFLLARVLQFCIKSANRTHHRLQKPCLRRSASFCRPKANFALRWRFCRAAFCGDVGRGAFSAMPSNSSCNTGRSEQSKTGKQLKPVSELKDDGDVDGEDIAAALDSTSGNFRLANLAGGGSVSTSVEG